MTELDSFSEELLEQAKRFLEKSKDTKDEKAINAYLNASLLIAVSSLEAFIYGIADDFSSSENFSLLEKALLTEKEIELKNGEFKLTKKLKMSRLTERIELLSIKFNSKNNIKSEKWWDGLLEGIGIRNDIVHPKSDTCIKIEQVERSISSIIECVNYLFLSVYRKGLPIYGLGLQSKYDY